MPPPLVLVVLTHHDQVVVTYLVKLVNKGYEQKAEEKGMPCKILGTDHRHRVYEEAKMKPLADVFAVKLADRERQHLCQQHHARHGINKMGPIYPDRSGQVVAMPPGLFNVT